MMCCTYILIHEFYAFNRKNSFRFLFFSFPLNTASFVCYICICSTLKRMWHSLRHNVTHLLGFISKKNRNHYNMLKISLDDPTYRFCESLIRAFACTIARYMRYMRSIAVLLHSICYTRRSRR